MTYSKYILTAQITVYGVKVFVKSEGALNCLQAGDYAHCMLTLAGRGAGRGGGTGGQRALLIFHYLFETLPS